VPLEHSYVTLITEHLYPDGAGGKVPSPETGRNQMLSDGFVGVLVVNRK